MSTLKQGFFWILVFANFYDVSLQFCQFIFLFQVFLFFCYKLCWPKGINLDPKWNKSSSSRPCFYIFMIFYWVFIKQGAILKKMTFSTLANCLRWIWQKYIWNNNFRSKDPKMNLVTNNTILFRHFKQGFSIFLEFFFIVVLYKSVTFNRLTDSCFFSLFTLRFYFFPFF